jgi:hypothetical protein
MFVICSRGLRLDVATSCVSVHGTYIALEPSLDGEEPTAFKAVVLSSSLLSPLPPVKKSILFRLRS